MDRIDPEISHEQRKELASHVLAAIGIGQTMRRWHILRAAVQPEFRWEQQARYVCRGLTEDVHAWFSYEVTSLGTRRPAERYQATTLRTLVDEGVTDRSRQVFKIFEQGTSYRRTLEVFDPTANGYQDVTINPDVFISDAQAPVQTPQPITESGYAEFMHIYGLIGTGDLTKQL